MTAIPHYDAIVIVSFGGPEGMDDVMPYLDNVLRGRNVPEDRKHEVAEHYKLFGGVSPINDQNRRLVLALDRELQVADIPLPVYWGNRNWHPLLPDTIRTMGEAGVRRALAFVTSAYSCYSGCRQYREDLQRACAEVGTVAPEIDKIRLFYNHPGFLACNADHIRATMERFASEARGFPRIIFTAHSVPLAMAQASRYTWQLNETCRLIAEELGLDAWHLAYQSRSGSPQSPWLGPSVEEALLQLKDNHVTNVILAPIGFVSDHMEIIFDLDTEAREFCVSQGITMLRAPTAGVHPAFVTMIRQLVEERLDPSAPRLFLGDDGPAPDQCPDDCCHSTRQASVE